ncbi:MAG: hypothetical protein V1794_18460 [Candidatus Glassbacteria bacterium]
MKKIRIIAAYSLLVLTAAAANIHAAWTLSALPSSVRLDPVSGKIIEDRPDIYKMQPLGDLLGSNWVYDGSSVKLSAARGEYVSFQIVIGRTGTDTLRDFSIEVAPFEIGGQKLATPAELFLEWSVRVDTRSFGYDSASYGPGWYPDALIPFSCMGERSQRSSRINYPISLPDFRNRIEGQRYLLVWVDQYLPMEREAAGPGVWKSEVTVKVAGEEKRLPVELVVWDFAIPNANSLAGNLQHEGFLRNQDEKMELAVCQLLRRNRIVPVDNGYRPGLKVTAGQVEIDWSAMDSRYLKYLSGEAFTARYGYDFGPGYGEPLEWLLLPFDCYSDHRGPGRPGWPDIGDQKEERKPENREIYIQAIRKFRAHVLETVDPAKTRLVVFQGGLDESYYSEAWERMVYYGKLFKEYFPEAHYRVDGGYSREAMEVIHEAIDYWCCHTVGYDLETVEEYRKLGITDWVYGPVLYERRGNSGVGSSTFIDLELSNERAISWACWKYRTLTWCSWGIGSEWRAAWYSPETWKFASRDQQGRLVYRSYNGNALEVYAPGIVPGVGVPCPTVRLKNMRDGVEEYEMLKLLAVRDGNPARADAAASRIIERPFGKQSVGRFDVWSHDPAEWDRVRIEIGRMIEKTGR